MAWVPGVAITRVSVVAIVGVAGSSIAIVSASRVWVWGWQWGQWAQRVEKAININLQFSLHLSGAYSSKRLSACRDMGGYLNGASQ